MYHTQEIQFLTHHHFSINGHIAYLQTNNSKVKSDNKSVRFFIEKNSEHSYHLKIERKKLYNIHDTVLNRTYSSWDELKRSLQQYL
jgi:hypothetical protein